MVPPATYTGSWDCPPFPQ